MKKILVVGVNWLGDAILTTPVFRALKETYPSSYVAVMTVPRAKDIFTANPFIDEVIIFDEKSIHRTFKEKLNFTFFLKKKKFKTVFLIHRSLTRGLICFFAGIKERIGYARLKTRIILTTAITAPKGTHRQDRYLILFENYGIKIKNKTPEVFIEKSIEEKMTLSLKGIKKSHRFFVGINPSANWEMKRWPLTYYAKLADRLSRKLNCAIVFVGAEKEKSLIENLLLEMDEKAYNFCAKTTLQELAALIKNSDLFISNDSGPAHLSAALGIKTLVIFGPTCEGLTGPKGEKVTVLRETIECEIPCYKLNCPDNICMKKIGLEKVFDTSKKILLE